MDSGFQALQNELEGYLAFFRRRLEIESEYAESLSKLSSGSTKLPPLRLDEKGPPLETSWRAAWIQLRSNVGEEASAHITLRDSLRKMIQDLGSFRDDKDRIRRRVKDDMRAATTEHREYVGEVGRLRKMYERKVEELQSHEEAEQSRDHEGGGWPPAHWSDGEGSHGRARSSSTASSRGGEKEPVPDIPPVPLSSPPIVPSTSPPPVFVSGAASTSVSSHAYGGHPPSAKGGNVFDALSKRDWSGEKKSLNSIVRAVGNLAKGEGGSGGVKPSAMKGVKARQHSSKLKREAEQADRDYRNAIFRLESLRLQRDRINRSATASLIEFASELSIKIKKAISNHVDALTISGQTRTAIAQHVQPEADRMDPLQDAEVVRSQIRIAVPAEPPVYYVNAFVGECRTLLFGVGLGDYCATRPDRLVPLIVQTCISQIETTGLDCEGIYRIPGKLATVQHLVHAIEKDEEQFSFDAKEEPANVAGVLKLYLRQLPTPLFPFHTVDRLVLSGEYAKDPEGQLASLSRRIRRLAPPHQATLKALCLHLSKVSEHEHQSKMNPTNLGVCFTPVVFGEDETATLESAMQSAKDIVMELLIAKCKTLFDEAVLAKPLSRRPSDVQPHSAPITSQEKLAVPDHIASPKEEVLQVVVPTPPAAQPHPTSSTSPAVFPREPLPNQLSAELSSGYSGDSVFKLYQDASALLPSPLQTSHSEADTLDSPTPPLSAAGGRHIPSEGSPNSSISHTRSGSLDSSPPNANPSSTLASHYVTNPSQ
ncbi:RhoGAP-domain-containing protein [Meredithblackwellia eburnea MCA 4105]